MRAASGLLLATLAYLVTHVLAQCDPGDGLSNFGYLSVFEDGTFKDVSEPSVSKDDYSAVSIPIQSNRWSSLFTIEESGNNWVLKAKETLGVWYDENNASDGDPTCMRKDFPITYTCASGDSSTPSPPHQMTVIGQNTEAPEFENASYSGTISKTLGVGFTLDSVPGGDFVITATDRDYLGDEEVTGCNTDVESNNEVECVALKKDTDDADDFFECSTEKKATGGYRIKLTLTQSLSGLTNNYEFRIISNDKGDPQLTGAAATVSLTFEAEDTEAPQFSHKVYEGRKITTLAETQNGAEFELGISVTDATWGSGKNKILTILPEATQAECDSCFTWIDDTKTGVKLVKDLSQQVLEKGMLILIIEASEDGGSGRKSLAVIQIPVIGDMHSPRLDKEFYDITVKEDGTITPNTFTPTDEDTVIVKPEAEYSFSMGTESEPSLGTCISIDGSTGELQLMDGGIECLQDLHTDYTDQIAFFIQVSNDPDQDRFTRSLVTLHFPMKTLSTAPTSQATTSTTQPSTTTTSEECPPCTTTTIEPTTCPETTCPEYTTPTPTTTTTISEGGREITITSGDFGELVKQHVGYPEFIQMENAVRMPLTRVEVTCEDREAVIEFSLSDTDTFYIDNSSGEVFLVNNGGTSTLPGSPSSFRAHANTAGATEKSIEITVEALPKQKVLVFDSSNGISEVGSILGSLNEASNSTVWFRLLNMQPRVSGRSSRNTEESLLFLTAFSTQDSSDTFLTRDEVESIVSVGGLNRDDDVEIDHRMEEQEEAGTNTATIVLAVLLGIIVIAIVLVLLFIYRGSIMEIFQKRRQTKNKIVDSESSSIKDDINKNRKSHGMFNLQSVTVQTNTQGKGAASATEPSQGLTGGAGAGKPRAAGPGIRVPGVGGAHVNNGFMREMSTELEKKLETRPRDRPITVTSNSQDSTARKGRAPATPRAPPAPTGITFNPVAEVVEVEKRSNRPSISSQGSGSSDSSSDSSSSGGSSITNGDEETTRI